MISKRKTVLSVLILHLLLLLNTILPSSRCAAEEVKPTGTAIKELPAGIRSSGADGATDDATSTLQSRERSRPFSSPAPTEGIAQPSKARPVKEEKHEITGKEKAEAGAEAGEERQPWNEKEKRRLSQELTRILQTRVDVSEGFPLARAQALILTTSAGSRILALLSDEHFLLGDIYTRNGENLCARFARQHRASTVLETFGTALETVYARLGQLKLPREYALPEESFTHILASCFSYPLASHQKEHKEATWQKPVLFLLSSPSCLHCADAEKRLRTALSAEKIPCNVIPVLRTEKDAALLCDRIGTGAANKDLHCTLLQNLARKNTEILRSILVASNTLTTPFYIWKLPDGTVLAGEKSVEKALERAKMLSRQAL